MYTISILPTKAHALLSPSEVWCQESPAKDALGHKFQAFDPNAVRWCALGAIQMLYPPSQLGEAMDRVLRALCVSKEGLARMTKSDKACCLMEWNDDPQTTFTEIKNITAPDTGFSRSLDKTCTNNTRTRIWK
jgi:hypothetical protein